MSHKSVYVRDANGGIQFPVRSIIGNVASVATSLSDAQREALTSELPCKLKTVKRPKAGTMVVDLSSASQARQLGYACAQTKTGDWMAQKVEDGVYHLVNTSTAESFRVTDGYEVAGKATEIKDGESRTVEISFHRPSVKQFVGEVPGPELPITLNVHGATNGTRQMKITAWTWYHILVRYLCDERVSAVDGEFRPEVEWGYRLEQFKIAGGDPRSIRRLSTVIPCEGGWAFEAYYKGRRNDIPVLVDTRFVNQNEFDTAAVAAIVTA